MRAGRRTRAAFTALLIAPAALAGCNEFLSAENPGAVEAGSLNDPRYVTLMVNGVIGEFQAVFPQIAMYNAAFTDEARNHHVFAENRLIDQRNITPENGTYGVFYYTPLQRFRFLADSSAGRLRIILGDSASRDVRLARTLAYAGYSYVMLGENLCAAPVDLSRAYAPEELFRDFALARFEEAITVATAAKAVTGATPATVGVADSIIAFARIGAARAALDLNDNAAAIQYAQAHLAVDPQARFEFQSYYSENTTRQQNPLYAATATAAGSASRWLSLNDTPFLAMVDPRVPRPPTREAMQDRDSAFVVNSPRAYSTWDSTVVGTDIIRAGFMRVATGLEARYILAEAGGPTAENIAFIESRRLLGPAGTEVTTAENYYANVRDQRSRDFYLDGHRLGDLRRFKAVYNVDLFQRGPYPGSTTGETYADQECWPLPLSELNGNPNL